MHQNILVFLPHTSIYYLHCLQRHHHRKDRKRLFTLYFYTKSSYPIFPVVTFRDIVWEQGQMASRQLGPSVKKPPGVGESRLRNLGRRRHSRRRPARTVCADRPHGPSARTVRADGPRGRSARTVRADGPHERSAIPRYGVRVPRFLANNCNVGMAGLWFGI